MKKLLSIVLIALLLCSVLPVAAFAESPTPWSSTNFVSCRVYYSTQPYSFNMTFTAIGRDICSELGLSSYTIVRVDDGYTFGPYAGSISTDTDVFSHSRVFYGASGSTYTIRAVFYSMLNGKFETAIVTPDPFTLPPPSSNTN